MKRGSLLALIIAMVMSASLITGAAPRPQTQTILGQHQVMPGETLFCIGRAYGVTPQAIAQANDLRFSAALAVGLVLAIPAVPWTAIPAGPVCTPQFDVAGGAPLETAGPQPATALTTYTVRRGDSLWRIAGRFNTTVAALRTANNLRSNTIYPGQLLVIPSTTTPSAAVASVAGLAATSVPAPTDGPAPPGQPAPTNQPPLPTQAATAAPANTRSAPTDAPPGPTDSPPAPTLAPTPTQAPSPVPTATTEPDGDPLNCAVKNITWSRAGQLLRGGRPEASALACLAAAGVDTIIDQRTPGEDSIDEPALAAAAGIEYINLGIADDTAPSPAILRAWIDTVNSRLAAGKIVLVHDSAGRGRMGFWDAVYFMLNRAGSETAIEDRYLAKTLPFSGAKIGCSDGGNGQVQALAEIAVEIYGSAYYPTVDEWGTTWAGCARPAYMSGWDYGSVLP